MFKLCFIIVWGSPTLKIHSKYLQLKLIKLYCCLSIHEHSLWTLRQNQKTMLSIWTVSIWKGHCLTCVLYVYQAETVWILVATKSLVDKFFVQAPRTMFNVNDQNSRTLSSLCIRPSLAHPAYNKHQSVILYLIFGLKQCMSCPNCGSHFILQHQLYHLIMELIHIKIPAYGESIYLRWLHQKMLVQSCPWYRRGILTT